ncbi:plantaricin C family lantibiotic [Bacillus infantis]|jgi:Lantibiotic alpha|uniref:plantaricin C family lantibiotic n=1 Tax=Bacillus infantis TaxID=324767 RepID=UPI002155E6E8|nr:plantaricin C family lantibiotic [Bacillus infantis]MCR6612844.1 plantaricin C family lantibiotic [Bacillus infantis]
MKPQINQWKNPYTRNQTNMMALPIEDPIKELQEEDLVNINGGVQERWAETVLTSLVCFGASYLAGNNGHVCTLTVECQKTCN